MACVHNVFSSAGKLTADTHNVILLVRIVRQLVDESIKSHFDLLHSPDFCSPQVKQSEKDSVCEGGKYCDKNPFPEAHM
jgi:hypothetical protein